jgi:hypothetical protein
VYATLISEFTFATTPRQSPGPGVVAPPSPLVSPPTLSSRFDEKITRSPETSLTSRVPATVNECPGRRCCPDALSSAHPQQEDVALENRSTESTDQLSVVTQYRSEFRVLLSERGRQGVQCVDGLAALAEMFERSAWG